MDNYRINESITNVKQVRLVGDNVEQGIYDYFQAMKIADELNLDLIEISSNDGIPVCRVADYQKFLYQQKKKKKGQESKQIETKEIRFTPNIGDNDYQFKLKHAMEFLKDGNKVKASVFFKGRSVTYADQGELLLANFCNDLADYGKPNKVPKLEGKTMDVTLTPIKKK